MITKSADVRAVALIPARGGSKSIPRKNLLNLCGRPLIAHTILAARGAKRVSKVLVTTDDPEIAEVARRFGADVINRPAELSGDAASSESALLHALSKLEGPLPEVTVFLQCTSPLTTAGQIDALVAAIQDDGADSALLVRSSHAFLWRKDGNGAAGVNHDPGVRLRRQDLTPEFAETGAGYAFRTRGFMETGHRFFGRIGLVETDTPPVEIDEPRDIPVLEALMAAPQAPEAPVAPEPLPARPDLIVFDFDGVMTDDRLIVREDGLESVICSRADGMGIERLRLAGHPMAVLSKEKNAVVMARCAKLGIECLQDIEDKATQLVALAESRRLDLDKIVYVGNDINDLAPMRLVGWPVAPADARPEIIHAARVVLPAPGGRGAVRALSDMILDRHGEQK